MRKEASATDIASSADSKVQATAKEVFSENAAVRQSILDAIDDAVSFRNKHGDCLSGYDVIRGTCIKMENGSYRWFIDFDSTDSFCSHANEHKRGVIEGVLDTPAASERLKAWIDGKVLECCRECGPMKNGFISGEELRRTPWSEENLTEYFDDVLLVVDAKRFSAEMLMVAVEGSCADPHYYDPISVLIDAFGFETFSFDPGDGEKKFFEIKISDFEQRS